MNIQRDLIAMAIYFIVLMGLMIRFKGKKFHYFSRWTGIFLVLYFCILEIQNKSFFILIPLFFFYSFAIFISKKKAGYEMAGC